MVERFRVWGLGSSSILGVGLGDVFKRTFCF